MSIPTRSGIESSGFVDSFSREDDSQNELSVAYREAQKIVDIGNQNIMVSILKEPAYDFENVPQSKPAEGESALDSADFYDRDSESYALTE